MDSAPTSNFDSLLLQSLMNRLQLQPNPYHSPLPSPSLEDLLLDALTNLSDPSDDDCGDEDEEGGVSAGKSRLAREESKLEKEIVRIVLSGDTASLKPNSGQAVGIGEHHICVGFHEEPGADYRVWEWHGHIMLFDEEDGYSPEYVYGNYFERLRRGRDVLGGDERKKKDVAEEVEEEEEMVGNLGLRELIDDGGEADNGVKRVLHRNINAGSPRLI